MKNLSSRKIIAFFNEVVDKFENKILREKESGQYSGSVYTPSQMAEFIIRNLFRIYLKDMFEEFGLKDDILLTNPRDLKALSSIFERHPEMKKVLTRRIEHIKIMDPACGSGRFLISAGKLILNIYKLLTPDLEEVEIKKNIIQNILYGVDLDIPAHNICKIRLLSWYLSDTSPKTSSDIDPKFISLKNATLDEILNNAEISFHIYNSDFLLEFNPHEKFDIILGNPPYIENKKIKDMNFKKKVKKRFTSAYRLYDLSIVFLEKSLEMLKENYGYLSFLMTNKFLAADYGIKIRTILLQNTEIKEIINISSLPVFAKAAIYPIILSFRKKSSNNRTKFTIQNCETLDDMVKYNFMNSKIVSQHWINTFPSKVIPIFGNIELMQYIFSNFKPMSQVINDLKIIYRPFGFLQWEKHFKNVSETKSSQNDLLLLGTGNVKQFHIDFQKRIRIAKRDIAISYFKYNEVFKDIWQDLSSEKLIFREIAKSLTALYDPGVFTNITGLYFITIPSFTTNKLFCLLSLLNSKLMDSIFKALFWSLHMSGGYLRFNGSFIKRLPIPESFPISLSYLGKINQVLSQILMEQNMLFFSSQEIEMCHTFFLNLSNSLVRLVYVKELFDNTKISNLLKLLTHPQEILPNIEFKFLFPKFSLPKFKLYSKKELELNLRSIMNSYKFLSKNQQLVFEIDEIANRVFKL